MSNYIVFQIPKYLIPNFNDRSYNKFKWDTYDEQCKRRDISLDTFEQILMFSGTDYVSPKNQLISSTPKHVGNDKHFSVHHIMYNLTKSYDITQHEDNCNFTVIIYIDKDETISDSFWVNDNLVNENFWDPIEGYYKALIFWGNANHKGIINGIGKREILCIFSD